MQSRLLNSELGIRREMRSQYGNFKLELPQRGTLVHVPNQCRMVHKSPMALLMLS